MKHKTVNDPIASCKACRERYLGKTIIGAVTAIYRILEWHYESLERGK